MNDFILIRDLKIYATHGVLAKEKEQGQFFYLTIKLYLSCSKASATDDLTASINYADVCHLITSYLKDHCFDLIESVAGKTIELLFSTYPQLSKIEVTVSKPSAPIGLPFDTVCLHMERKKHTAYISLGSNMGNTKEHLEYGLSALNNHPYCFVTSVSDFIITKPYGPVAQADFLNACACVETWLDAEEFLDLLLSIEASAHRERLIHWGPRTLDLDLLLFDNEIHSTKHLTVPHPEMHKRQFVLEPLAQIAPYALHPLLNKRISELFESLPTS